MYMGAGRAARGSHPMQLTLRLEQTCKLCNCSTRPRRLVNVYTIRTSSQCVPQTSPQRGLIIATQTCKCSSSRQNNMDRLWQAIPTSRASLSNEGGAAPGRHAGQSWRQCLPSRLRASRVDTVFGCFGRLQPRSSSSPILHPAPAQVTTVCPRALLHESMPCVSRGLSRQPYPAVFEYSTGVGVGAVGKVS